jgi:hypothetical protein
MMTVTAIDALAEGPDETTRAHGTRTSRPFKEKPRLPAPYDAAAPRSKSVQLPRASSEQA